MQLSGKGAALDAGLQALSVADLLQHSRIVRLEYSITSNLTRAT